MRLIALFAWVLRFGLFGAGNPGSGVWMLILSMIVYGVAFDFFNISGSLFVDSETDPNIRSSAQGLFMLMTNGIGATIVRSALRLSSIVSCSRNGRCGTGCRMEYGLYIFAAYAFVVAVLFALIFKYKHNPTPFGKSDASERATHLIPAADRCPQSPSGCGLFFD